jgi:hypothetical protein
MDIIIQPLTRINIPITMTTAPVILWALIGSWNKKKDAKKIITNVKAIKGYTKERSALDRAISQNSVEMP